ncbi:MAG: hypothetical protein KF830_06760 [Planctomycetes bacterium]|nr:hypothetical protein [Planctomycetota bacterium]
MHKRLALLLSVVAGAPTAAPAQDQADVVVAVRAAAADVQAFAVTLAPVPADEVVLVGAKAVTRSVPADGTSAQVRLRVAADLRHAAYACAQVTADHYLVSSVVEVAASAAAPGALELVAADGPFVRPQLDLGGVEAWRGAGPLTVVVSHGPAVLWAKTGLEDGVTTLPCVPRGASLAVLSAAAQVLAERDLPLRAAPEPLVVSLPRPLRSLLIGRQATAADSPLRPGVALRLGAPVAGTVRAASRFLLPGAAADFDAAPFALLLAEGARGTAAFRFEAPGRIAAVLEHGANWYAGSRTRTSAVSGPADEHADVQVPLRTGDLVAGRVVAPHLPAPGDGVLLVRSAVVGTIEGLMGWSRVPAPAVLAADGSYMLCLPRGERFLLTLVPRSGEAIVGAECLVGHGTVGGAMVVDRPLVACRVTVTDRAEAAPASGRVHVWPATWGEEPPLVWRTGFAGGAFVGQVPADAELELLVCAADGRTGRAAVAPLGSEAEAIVDLAPPRRRSLVLVDAAQERPIVGAIVALAAGQGALAEEAALRASGTTDANGCVWLDVPHAARRAVLMARAADGVRCVVWSGRCDDAAWPARIVWDGR